VRRGTIRYGQKIGWTSNSKTERKKNLRGWSGGRGEGVSRHSWERLFDELEGMAAHSKKRTQAANEPEDVRNRGATTRQNQRKNGGVQLNRVN